MFGWLKRKMHREHRKLAYQNFEAAHDPEMKTLAGLNGEWAAFDSYDAARQFSVDFIYRLSGEGGASKEDIAAALDLNKDLRRVFDAIGRKDRGSFDAVYRPLGGWPFYFERHDCEVSLIERMKEIEAEMGANLAENGRHL